MCFGTPRCTTVAIIAFWKSQVPVWRYLLRWQTSNLNIEYLRTFSPTRVATAAESKTKMHQTSNIIMQFDHPFFLRHRCLGQHHETIDQFLYDAAESLLAAAASTTASTAASTATRLFLRHWLRKDQLQPDLGAQPAVLARPAASCSTQLYSLRAQSGLASPGLGSFLTSWRSE